MNYPFSERNWLCRNFGHNLSRRYVDCDGTERRTCPLDGHTEPPFRKVQQFPPYDFLPDDQQPAGAV
jgi:hypothetical protein